MAKTLFEKVWDRHVVCEEPGEPALLYVDLHLVHEVTSAQAFEGLRLAGRRVRRPDLTVATMDHNVPTLPGPVTDPMAQGAARRAARELRGVRHPRSTRTGSGQRGDRPRDRPGARAHAAGHDDRLRRQPHVDPRRLRRARVRHRHVRGRARPRDADAATSAARRRCSLEFVGELPPGLTAKDLILGAIGQVGVDGGVGHVVEYAGDAIRALSMEERMTICNMSIEWGARAGMIAPDETTFAYLEGRPHAPQRRGLGARGRATGARSPTDPDATYDTHVVVDVAKPRAAGDLGDEPGDGRARHRVACPTRRRSTTRTTAPRPSARSRTWTSGPASRSRTSGSTACSSARARTRGSRTCAPPRRSSRGNGRRTREGARRPRLRAGASPGRGGGARPGLPRRGLRVAPRRLLDVPRDEPRHPRRRASAAPRPRTGTSRAARAAAAARTSSARRWRRPPRSTATSSTFAHSDGESVPA